MKRILLLAIALLFLIPGTLAESVTYVGESYSVSDSPYKLTLFWPQGEEPPAHRQVFLDIYFSCYPLMREIYGTTDTTEVGVFFHHAPDSIAYASNNDIFVSIEYLAANPDDHNLFIHELFHIVQNGYVQTDPFVPALTEGLADYARAKYAGSSPEADTWQLARYEEGQSYMDSYRVTGAFLNWIAETWEETTLIRLNRALHEGRYHADLWKEYTGLNLDDLWAAYSVLNK